MSRWGFCNDEGDHKRQAERDFDRGGRYGYDRDRYGDNWDSCNEVYTEEFDRLRREEDRRQERLEEERIEERRQERQQLEREREAYWLVRYEQEQQENDREDDREPEEEFGPETCIVGFAGP